MRHTTRGIVLNYIKYQETSIIVKIFTEVFGKQSYLVKGVRMTKPKHAIALFQPLMTLDLLVSLSRNSTLHHLVEVKCHLPATHLFTDLKKATIAVFITELFHKAVSEAEEDLQLFNFLLESAVKLNNLEKGHVIFYLDFMLSFAKHLGFACNGAGISQQLVNNGFHHFSQQDQIVIDSLLQKDTAHLITSLTKEQVRNLTTALVHFLQLHIASLEELNSLKILQSINE